MIRLSCLAAGLSLLALPALAHVHLAPEHAVRGTTGEFTFTVGHGCDGAATTAVRLILPPEIVKAVPQASGDWTVTAQTAQQDRPGTVEWLGKGAPADKPLPLTVTLSVAPDAQPGPVPLRVMQVCGKTQIGWTQFDAHAKPMDHDSMDHGSMDHGAMDHGAMDHGAAPATPAAPAAPAAAGDDRPAPVLVIDASASTFAAVTQNGVTLLDGSVKAPPAPTARTVSAHLVLRNEGPGDKMLVSVSSPAAEKVELHSMKVDNGIARMRAAQDGIALPPKVAVDMMDAGYHVMLIGPRQQLKAGETVPVTLTFQDGTALTAALPVQ